MHHFSYGKSHPGVRLGELLRKSPALTHETLAKRLSVSSYRLRTLLKGEKAVAIDLALKLACIFPEYTARDWLDMQTAHDLHQAYTSGKMDAIAKEMGAETRNVSKIDWLRNISKKSEVLQITLRPPLNFMLAALSEKLALSQEGAAEEAIRQLWQNIDKGESLNS